MNLYDFFFILGVLYNIEYIACSCEEQICPYTGERNQKQTKNMSELVQQLSLKNFVFKPGANFPERINLMLDFTVDV